MGNYEIGEVLFWDEAAWHKAIAAMVREGVTFRAEAPGCGNATWKIVLTGGY